MAERLLSLRGFTLISTWPELASKSREEFDEWLADCGLLWKKRSCPNCGEPCTLTKQGKMNQESVRLKFECFRQQCRQPGIPRKIGYLKDTFFEGLRVDRKKIFLASYLFAYDLGTVKEMARTLEVSESSIVQWTQWFREVLVEYYTNNVSKIGGPNTVVQVDETCIVRRVGGIERKEWLFGGIQEGTKLVFMEIIDDHSSATLDAIIQKHVLPGGYHHETVNHSENVVDPDSGVHTQRTENFWNHLKAKIRSRHGLKGELWDDYFFEVLWKWQFNSEDLLYELWKLIAARHPIS
ncbi:hypothetical protein V3C99_002344 [Haemonchus contortus]